MFIGCDTALAYRLQLVGGASGEDQTGASGGKCASCSAKKAKADAAKKGPAELSPKMQQFMDKIDALRRKREAQ